MDWVHCNTCFIRPHQDNTKHFALTSCGHIYCSLCLKSGSNDSCKVCGSTYTTVELTSQMRTDIQEYFMDPLEMLKKVNQVIAFQQGHRSRLLVYNNTIVSKYNVLKEEFRKLLEAHKALQKKFKDCEKTMGCAKQKFISTQPQQSDCSLSMSQMLNSSTPTVSQFSTFAQPSPQSSGQLKTKNRLILPRRSQMDISVSPVAHVSPSQEHSSRTPQQMIATGSSHYRSAQKYTSTPKTPLAPNMPLTPETPGTPIIATRFSSPFRAGHQTPLNQGDIPRVNTYRAVMRNTPTIQSLSRLSLSDSHLRH